MYFMRHLSLAEQKNHPGPSYEFTKNPAHTLSKIGNFAKIIKEAAMLFARF